jgi:Cyclin, N-terminal domain
VSAVLAEQRPDEEDDHVCTCLSGLWAAPVMEQLRTLRILHCFPARQNLMKRLASLFEWQHLSVRGRASCVDWMQQLCNERYLGREVFYLAVDYFDRFLTAVPDVPMHMVQLVGLGAVIVAAKLQVSMLFCSCWLCVGFFCFFFLS